MKAVLQQKIEKEKNHKHTNEPFVSLTSHSLVHDAVEKNITIKKPKFREK